MAASAAALSAAAARAPSAASWTTRSRRPAAAARAVRSATKSSFDNRRFGLAGRRFALVAPACFRDIPDQRSVIRPLESGMRIMQGDARVIEYLNRGLRHELAAINQYWLHYRLLHNWGYLSLAKKWHQESMDEMQHADKMLERSRFL